MSLILKNQSVCMLIGLDIIKNNLYKVKIENFRNDFCTSHEIGEEFYLKICT
ncbi:hypothetical protein CCAND95_10129 [Capnocytophaga canis]|uniref:Uncharacterized protein n=1 Tax=Capnocytophaga canis TaxID=1848903 RepID=A0A0B7I0I7_9FLAO|nr:hypothetical protein CCAND95_10129 [Capnocytophaga canis]CEN43243.1 hypothetical protein CCAND38_10124 [Capnocytophaga canis]